MLTRRQIRYVKIAAHRAVDQEQFDAFVTDAVTGKDPTDKELRWIVDSALAIARTYCSSNQE